MNLTPGFKYLFDTTVYVDLLHKRSTAVDLYHQTRSLRLNAGYSIITESELWAGIRGLLTEQEHIELLKPYKRYFMNVTIARRAGMFRKVIRESSTEGRGGLPGLPDCIIAATADFYDLMLVSKNTRHMNLFEQFGVKVVEYHD